MSTITDPLRRLTAALASLAASSAMAFGVPGEPGQQLRLSPEQRQLMLQQMTPEQREAMRQRFLQRQEQQPGSGPAGGKRLTPEERQRLRDQIRESQGDWKGGAAQKGGPR